VERQFEHVHYLNMYVQLSVKDVSWIGSEIYYGSMIYIVNMGLLWEKEQVQKESAADTKGKPHVVHNFLPH
jgi:hypothetical protein